jgi:hypothetical protein
MIQATYEAPISEEMPTAFRPLGAAPEVVMKWLLEPQGESKRTTYRASTIMDRLATIQAFHK